MFGEDSEHFNIDRWLDGDGKKSVQGVGVYANLLTFAHGPRACIGRIFVSALNMPLTRSAGWRMSLLELQMLMIKLLPAFQFSLPAGGSSVYKKGAMTATPTVNGQLEGGGALYLDVSLIE